MVLKWMVRPLLVCLLLTLCFLKLYSYYTSTNGKKKAVVLYKTEATPNRHLESKQITPQRTQHEVEFQTQQKAASIEAGNTGDIEKVDYNSEPAEFERYDNEVDNFWQVDDRNASFEKERVVDDKVDDEQAELGKVGFATEDSERVNLAKVYGYMHDVGPWRSTTDDAGQTTCDTSVGVLHDKTRNLRVEKQHSAGASARVPGDIPETGRQVIDLDRWDVDSDELFRRLVVVTAFSENHRLEAMGMISTVQHLMPATRIIAYDLGIEPRFLHTVTQLCNVEVRPFEFARYPPHVANILTYAWKILTIKETLSEFGAIFWADASVRFLDSLRTLLPFAKEHHGYLSPIHSYQPKTKSPLRHNFYFTQQRMFDYFGINRTEYAESDNAPHIAANRQLLINSTTLQSRVIAPLYACALEETCLSPPGSERGNHQFDASALMLVVYKYLPGEFNRGNDHSADMTSVMKMIRRFARKELERAKVC